MRLVGRATPTLGTAEAPEPRPSPTVDSLEAARTSTYPPPYPEGWYVVARSDELRSKPRFVRCVGESWALFRDASGQPCIVDAYCPHLGANLADGCVREGNLQCPFHGWRVAGDGHVVGRPEPTPPDSRYRTRAWATDELHGWVLAYHRPGSDGTPVEPPYRLQRVPGIDTGQLVHRGDYDAGRVRMHLIEFAENSVDFRHFSSIHGELRVPWTEIGIPGMRIRHEASWRRDPDEPHVAWFGDQALLEFRGKPIKDSGATAEVRFEGPGGVVRFDFKLDKGGGRVVMFQSHSPVAPLEQHVRFRWFSERRVPKLLASFVVGNWISQWRQDISIWERKVYRRSPLLTRADGPIHQLRRWYSQFYEAG
ncbi:MAG: Rieske 2Fe-2S domain-containing protein [Myxococcota bacterium]